MGSKRKGSQAHFQRFADGIHVSHTDVTRLRPLKRGWRAPINGRTLRSHGRLGVLQGGTVMLRQRLEQAFENQTAFRVGVYGLGLAPILLVLAVLFVD